MNRSSIFQENAHCIRQWLSGATFEDIPLGYVCGTSGTHLLS
jgi:hypothetical protein